MRISRKSSQEIHGISKTNFVNFHRNVLFLSLTAFLVQKSFYQITKSSPPNRTTPSLPFLLIQISEILIFSTRNDESVYFDW